MRHDDRPSIKAEPAERRPAIRAMLLASAMLLGGPLLDPWTRAIAQAPTPAVTAPPAQVTANAATPDPAAEDAALALRQKRDEVGRELQELARSMRVSDDKAAELEKSIAALSKTSESLKQALIESAARRKDLERKIAAGEKKLADLGVSEEKIRHTFKDRRAILAEVLAALQRMGRNPPPALLVSPEDALASVRTAILLGAVVPGIRKETEKLAADLASWHVGILLTKIYIFLHHFVHMNRPTANLYLHFLHKSL